MTMDPRLIQSQSQKLILSPQIRQYLRLLQLPIYELQQEIDSELMANPLLEERSASVDEETPGELPYCRTGRRRRSSTKKKFPGLPDYTLRRFVGISHVAGTLP